MNFLNRISTKIVILCLIFATFIFSPNVFGSLNQTTFNNQNKALNEDISQITSQIEEITASLEDASKQKATLREQQAQTEIDIATITSLITKTEGVIAKLDKQILEDKKNIANLEAQMRIVIKEIQKNQNVSPIQKLISSENFGDAISKLYALSNSQNKANELKNDLEDSLKEQEVNLAKQQQTQADLNTSKALLEGKKQYLAGLIANYKGKEDQYAAEIAKLQTEQKLTESQAKKLQADWEAEKARIAAEQKKQQQSGGSSPKPPSSGGGGNSGVGYIPGNCFFEDASNPGIPAGYFVNPVSGGRFLRAFGSCNHDAVDIGASTGTPIKAAANGVVEAKGSFNVFGYGHWVLIRHTLPNGYRIYSGYAHMKAPSPLAIGTNVTKGSTIVGNVGCTGSCSGSHVHFILHTQSYETGGVGCRLGNSKCFNPTRYINF